MNFDNPDVGPDAPSGLFGADGEDVGRGVSALLIQKLLQGGRYTIVDRSALAKLLREQSDAENGRVDAYGMAARIGRLLSLDAMIIGGVTRYGTEEKHKDASGGIFGSTVRARKSKAYVEITAQILNITTGEVMASFTGAGESSRTGEITAIGARGRAGTSMEMLGSEFVESLLPEATASAVEQIATQLNLFAGKIPALHVAVEGRIAEVAGNRLTLNVGKIAGLKVGDQLEVLREAQAAADLGKPQGAASVLERVGLAVVTDVSEDYATATFSGSGSAQVGDRVKVREKASAAP